MHFFSPYVTYSKRHFFNCLYVTINISFFSSPDKDVTIKSVRILCNSNDIVVSIETNAAFNGMIYPKGLSKNSSCMAEFREQNSPVLYKLPLKSCSTMSSEMVSEWLVLLACLPTFPCPPV